MPHAMPFSLDPIVTNELTAHMAAQLGEIENQAVIVEDLQRHFSGERSKEFYEGLLAGYTIAHTVMSESGSNPTPQALGKLGAIVAFVASRVLDLRFRRH